MNRSLLVFIVSMALVCVLAGGIAGAIGAYARASVKPSLSQPAIGTAPLAPFGDDITYQGSLNDGGVPANGSYDFTFRMYNALLAGNVTSGPISATLVLNNGLFTVPLDFGPTAFNGEALWLSITVRRAGVGNYTTLTPRQPITPAPYASFAATAGTLPWRNVGERPFGYNPLPQDNTLTTLNSTNAVDYTAVTIGVDGLPLIAYYDSTNSDLRVAHCDDIACTGVFDTFLDNTGIVGVTPAITIGADGLGLIAYRDGTNFDLKVAHCYNIICSLATITTVDSVGNVGAYPSITLGVAGEGLISYYDITNGDLKVAYCTNPTCSTANLNTVDSAGDVGSYTSVTIGGDGKPLISYQDTVNDNLKVAHCTNPNCSGSLATITTLDSTGFVGAFTSITTGADQLGIVAYYDSTNSDLKIAHCSNLNCTSATVTTIYSTGSTGLSPAITIGIDDLGLISYYDATQGNLQVAHCDNPTCTTATSFFLDTFFDVGDATSVTIGVDGLPIISFADNTNTALKTVHCGSPICRPYLRRR
jgi:hypothetical protein